MKDKDFPTTIYADDIFCIENYKEYNTRVKYVRLDKVLKILKEGIIHPNDGDIVRLTKDIENL